MTLKDRIRGYLPVVIDVETAGFNENTDALLEICAIILGFDDNGIDIDNPFRLAVPEKEALSEIFQYVSDDLVIEECTRAILVGHNAFFDLGFVKAATNRSKLKSPFHQFSTLDTVSLSALYCGETVLAKAAVKSGIEWDNEQAHSALYDTKKTSELFCKIFNSQSLL